MGLGGTGRGEAEPPETAEPGIDPALNGGVDTGGFTCGGRDEVDDA